MKKILILICLLITSLLLTSCGPVSSYKALLLSTNQGNNVLKVSFESLEGTYIKKINNTNNMDGMIYFEISSSSGSFEVYYETKTQAKQMLTSVSGERSVKEKTGYVQAREDVTIYIITNGKAKGSVNIYLV